MPQHKLSLLLALITTPMLFACHPDQQIKEADKALKKRDSILKAFKTADKMLDSLNHAHLQKDSIHIRTITP